MMHACLPSAYCPPGHRALSRDPSRLPQGHRLAAEGGSPSGSESRGAPAVARIAMQAGRHARRSPPESDSVRTRVGRVPAPRDPRPRSRPCDPLRPGSGPPAHGYSTRWRASSSRLPRCGPLRPARVSRGWGEGKAEGGDFPAARGPCCSATLQTLQARHPSAPPLLRKGIRSCRGPLVQTPLRPTLFSLRRSFSLSHSKSAPEPSVPICPPPGKPLNNSVYAPLLAARGPSSR